MKQVGETEGKVWGKTQLIFRSEGVEIHKIKVKQGGFCSMHQHRSKQNWFHILSGVLRLYVENGDGKSDVIDLQAGETATVGFGKFHRFYALEDTEALEAYWSVMDSEDIVRRDVGGYSTQTVAGLSGGEK